VDVLCRSQVKDKDKDKDKDKIRIRIRIRARNDAGQSSNSGKLLMATTNGKIPIALIDPCRGRVESSMNEVACFRKPIS
jgi:hypothetical protein